MPSRGLHIYATKRDLIELIEPVEGQLEVRYTERGHARHGEPKVYDSVTQLPDLGIATSESASTCRGYLVHDRRARLKVRPVGTDGRFSIDQLENPDTVSFGPGGVLGDDILLFGRFATVELLEFSTQFMKAIRSSARKRFERIQAFYVGPEAAQMLDQGKRLTAAAQSPREYDLRRDASLA